MNTVHLVGDVASDPVERSMPSGELVTELRISAPPLGEGQPGDIVRGRLPLPVVVWSHDEAVYARVRKVRKGDYVAVTGSLVRRFYRSGAGARSLTEVVAWHVSTIGRTVDIVRERDGDDAAAMA